MTTATNTKPKYTKEDEITLLHLLSACADACYRGCRVIRFVEEKRRMTKKKLSEDDKSNNEGAAVPTNGASSASASASSTPAVGLEVKYKDPNDTRSALTEADGAAQDIIFGSLRSVWGDALNLVGEEDEGEEEEQNENGIKEGGETKEGGGGVKKHAVFEKYNIPDTTSSPLNVDIFSKLPIPSHLSNSDSTTKGEEQNGSENKTHLAGDLNTKVKLSDITLYVDPMDGTREFVEGRLDNVQSLIGIIHKGKPVAGITGLPFFKSHDDNDESIHILSALIWDTCTFVEQIAFQDGNPKIINDEMKDSWLSKFQRRQEPIDPIGPATTTTTTTPEYTIHVYTSDSNRLQKRQCVNFLKEWTKDYPDGMINMHKAGGCGNKILSTSCWANAKSKNAIAVITPGTCSWDTASSSGLFLSSMKKFGRVGKVSDLLGGDLVYDPSGKKITNNLGVLVSCGDVAVKYHERLCGNMRKNPESLKSLVGKYWNSDNDESEAANDLAVQKANCVFGAARRASQSFDATRDMNGYVMSCHEVQTELSKQLKLTEEQKEKVSIGGLFELMGYAIPEKETSRQTCGSLVGKMYLNWKKVHGEKRKCANGIDESPTYEPPSVVLYKKTMALVEFNLVD